ncbi:hypothetical protein JN531_014445 [Flagellatimonas centrodinii]|uniref:hypothetical protein n=1 Tax=Flagellatimonas centrodinii TaxID=2806210 RepID=UPI001FEDB567|nr:hypothetical protein [Flagellatimonas centrodinii]ULQ46288.1 hypothetical protein JN531_014445 [Flagellatimonas centrodinii]
MTELENHCRACKKFPHEVVVIRSDIKCGRQKFEALADMLSAAEMMLLGAEEKIYLQLLAPGLIASITLDDGVAVTLRINSDELVSDAAEEEVRNFLSAGMLIF